MDIIDSSQAVTVIVSGATGYLSQFMPIFAFAIGFALAITVIYALVSMFTRRYLHDDEEGV